MRSHREHVLVAAAKWASLDYEREMFEENHGFPDIDQVDRTRESIRELKAALDAEQYRLNLPVRERAA
jgi:hypothetical protein